ncbi:MAG: Crp/Fnr family transcriptional regulator [Treponema sp.]|nr:Crp/Fnr family transcriptional regulator [Treponema sp.]
MNVKEAFSVLHVTAELSPVSLSRLELGTAVRRYKKGDVLFRDREKVATIFGVLDGAISLHKMSVQGEKRGIFIFGRGALLNDDALGDGMASATAEVLRDSALLCLNRELFAQTARKDGELSAALIHSVSKKVRRLYHLTRNNSGSLNGGKRIAAKLWKLSRDHGVRTAKGTEIDFDLGITGLAEFLGYQRETVSRQVKVLSEAGLLIVENSRFVIPDRDRLLKVFEPG